jgi:catecholate siderophore receptor
VSVRSFFGNTAVNDAFAHVDGGRVMLEHLAGTVTIRNQTRYTWYDKFYQNVLPGAVDASGTRVALSAYNNATQRTNAFNQTDLTWGAGTGSAWHTLLAGVEVGRQGTTNYRKTGYFPGHAATMSAPLAQPTVADPVSFEHAGSDADNEVATAVAAAYAQDQVALSPRWQAVLGARWERFALNFDNHNTHGTLRRTDAMLSPRGGLVFKPVDAMSLYASTSVSHLPSSGDQFSSLTATTETLKPERFTNYELGAKWDATADLSLSTALYRLDRTNSQAKDPNDAARTIQTGAQRTVGWELGVAGSPVARWQVAGGVASQRAWVARTTASAAAGATVPLVPARTLSLWNRVELFRGTAIGLGAVHQARSYAAIDNKVTLPAFTRLDGALFVALPARLRAQVNAENLGNVRYFPTSQGNNNILPGSPRAWRIALSTGL